MFIFNMSCQNGPISFQIQANVFKNNYLRVTFAGILMGRVIKSCVLYESTQEELFACGFLIDLKSRTICLWFPHESPQSNLTITYLFLGNLSEILFKQASICRVKFPLFSTDTSFVLYTLEYETIVFADEFFCNILCFVDRASRHNFQQVTKLTHSSFIQYLYFNPLHVSSKHVLIIRRSIVLIQHLVWSISVSNRRVCSSSSSCSTLLDLHTGRPLTESD